MITEKLRKAIANRAATDDEWDYGVQQSWKEILSIISESLDDIVDFVENDCTADEFSWLSEIYNEIIDVFPSKRIITALRKTASKYPDEVKKFNKNVKKYYSKNIGKIEHYSEKLRKKTLLFEFL